MEKRDEIFQSLEKQNVFFPTLGKWGLTMKTKKVLALIALLAAGVQGAVRDEWTFQNDLGGTLLANAVNTGLDGSVFGAGGTGVLETDGLGALLSTP